MTEKIKALEKTIEDLSLRITQLEKNNIVHNQLMPRITNSLETINAKLARTENQQIEIMKEQNKMGGFLGNLQGQVEQLKQERTLKK